MAPFKQILLCNRTGLHNENGAKSFLLEKPRVHQALSNHYFWTILFTVFLGNSRTTDNKVSTAR